MFFVSNPMRISTNKGMREVRARYDAALPPNISIVRHPGRPVISSMDLLKLSPFMTLHDGNPFANKKHLKFWDSPRKANFSVLFVELSEQTPGPKFQQQQIIIRSGPGKPNQKKASS